ncbi:MAG: VOC family protein [Bryobacteraceae bacterium]|nr:VOC family protein [Bryobacteraceae bacterium]
MTNPVVYFEIPVTDLGRAMRFYGAVFGFAFERESIDGNEMALFPLVEGAAGISGALAKGSIYVPSKTGSVIYFAVDDLAKTLARVNATGGKTLYPVTAIGANGSVAEFEDSEGNRVALHSKN